jgi:hypothetical protein
VIAVREASPVLASGIFALAAVTDFADGRVARARGQTSARGGFLDHAVDAVFASGARRRFRRMLMTARAADRSRLLQYARFGVDALARGCRPAPSAAGTASRTT